MKKEILAHVVGFVEQHAALTISAEELQHKMNEFVLQLNKRYGMFCFGRFSEPSTTAFRPRAKEF